MTNMLDAASIATVDTLMRQSFEAFNAYKQISVAERALFLQAIADEIELLREQLVQVAGEESNLPSARLNGELTRTTNQLKLFALYILEGSWVEAAIDAPDSNNTAKPDIRKMLVPAGPVIVFGASNFPFAFSTAGGDTASALAAGSSVVIKAHPAHSRTSSMIFSAIQKAIQLTNMPLHTVQHAVAEANALGKELVQHPLTAGVGFTGSFIGGKALYQYAQQREALIPFFAEMSSINPVVFYPNILEEKATELAASFAGSITLGAGQFCTNPGLLIGLKNTSFEYFLQELGVAISKVAPQKMLHKGIGASYNKGVAHMLQQEGVQVIGKSGDTTDDIEAHALLVSVSGANFMQHKHFSEEVFGPFSLAVICNDIAELQQVLLQIKGQLTTTIVANENDIVAYAATIAVQQTLAGRVILNNPPTGVEVCNSMVHGGAYPATTDARFTSVGTSAIKRWVRPVCYQNFHQHMLPAALKNDNPLGILRLQNDVYTRDALLS